MNHEARKSAATREDPAPVMTRIRRRCAPRRSVWGIGRGISRGAAFCARGYFGLSGPAVVPSFVKLSASKGGADPPAEELRFLRRIGAQCSRQDAVLPYLRAGDMPTTHEPSIFLAAIWPATAVPCPDWSIRPSLWSMKSVPARTAPSRKWGWRYRQRRRGRAGVFSLDAHGIPHRFGAHVFTGLNHFRPRRGNGEDIYIGP